MLLLIIGALVLAALALVIALWQVDWKMRRYLSWMKDPEHMT